MKSTRVGPALTGGPSGKAGDAHDPRGRLDRHVHRQIVAVGAAEPEAGARGVDQPRVDLVQPAPADAEAVHRAGREIFEQHVGALDHAEQQFATARLLQIEGHRVLVLVQHRERQGGALAGIGAAAAGLAARRLDLDHKGAGLGHQQGRIGALKDLAEIDDRDPRQRHVRPRLNHCCFAPRHRGNFSRIHPPREAC